MQPIQCETCAFSPCWPCPVGTTCHPRCAEESYGTYVPGLLKEGLAECLSAIVKYRQLDMRHAENMG